ncbi:MAG: hypothetical protein QG673_1094, partial [Pseudomonadota bacterium]|nr:hypothetical protein [Pseudomonadota bacterium]
MPAPTIPNNIKPNSSQNSLSSTQSRASSESPISAESSPQKINLGFGDINSCSSDISDTRISDLDLQKSGAAPTDIDESVDRFASEIETILVQNLEEMKKSDESNPSKNKISPAGWGIKVNKENKTIDITHKDGTKLTISSSSSTSSVDSLKIFDYMHNDLERQKQFISLMQFLFKKTGGSNSPEVYSILGDLKCGDKPLLQNLFSFCKQCENKLNTE